jgi:hypothetical protein
MRAVGGFGAGTDGGSGASVAGVRACFARPPLQFPRRPDAPPPAPSRPPPPRARPRPQLCRYAGKQSAATAWFLAFAGSFIFLRCYIFPKHLVLKCLKDPIELVTTPYGINPQVGGLGGGLRAGAGAPPAKLELNPTKPDSWLRPFLSKPCSRRPCPLPPPPPPSPTTPSWPPCSWCCTSCTSTGPGSSCRWVADG